VQSRHRAEHRARPFLEALEERVLPAAGGLDLSFGTGGKVLTNTTLQRNDIVTDLALLPGGDIIALGETDNAQDNDGDVALVRYFANGAVDTDFGNNGKVITNVSGFDSPKDVLVDSSGRILVAGDSSTFGLFGGITSDRMFLARYLSDGTLDTSFGNKGIVLADLGDEDIEGGLALQPDGRIVLAGTTDIGGARDVAIVRYLPDGSLDTSFGGSGKVLANPVNKLSEINDVAVLADGKILLAGSAGVSQTEDALVLIRYRPDGTLDTGFGINGVAEDGVGANRFSFVDDLAIQPDGKILLAGDTIGAQDSFTGFDILLARLNADGTLDSTFGSGGAVITDSGFHLADFGKSVALQPNGKIVVAGRTGSSQVFGDTNANFGLVRYLPDGSLDPTFGSGGLVSTDFANDFDGADAVLVLPDGHILAGGPAVNGPSEDFGLARYQGDPGITIDNVNFIEGTNPSGTRDVQLQVHVTGGVTNPALFSVDFTTVAGSATAGSDFQPTSGTLQFDGSRNGATILVPIIGDALPEPNETFSVVLSNPVNANILDDTALVTLVDDDQPSSSLSGAVYRDLNFNSVRDAGETGIGGVTVKLFQVSSTGATTLVATQTTTANGSYNFTGLTPGRYNIQEVQPPGFLDGQEQVGVLGGAVSNDLFSNILLPQGVAGTGYNFGETIQVLGGNLPALFPGRSFTSPIAEGSEAVLTGTVLDPNPHDHFILHIWWGDGSPVETHRYGPGSDDTPISLAHRYADNGTYTVHLEWRDQHDAGNSTDLTVVVTNVAPVVQAGGNAVLHDGKTLVREGSFTDPGADLWTATVDFGDGSGVQPLTLHGDGQFVLKHDYLQTGTYQVTVTVTDDDGGVGTTTFLVTVQGSHGKPHDGEDQSPSLDAQLTS
jgi:uncharacterized delta-60 repeat protein